MSDKISNFSKIHEALFFLVNPFGGTELSKQIEGMGKMPSHLKPEDFDYYAMPFNASDIPDKRLHRLYTLAYIRFYFNPVRIIRILKAKSMWNDLLYQFNKVLKDLFPPHGNKRLLLEPIDFEFKKINKKGANPLPLPDSSEQVQDNVIGLSSARKKN